MASIRQRLVLPSTAVPASRHRMRPLVLAMLAGSAVSMLAAPALAQTLPSGMTVVHGQANAVRNGNTLTVTNSANAVLNWSSFSIGSGQSVRFQQPDANSQVLNRVVGNDPSSIFGSLSSNGKVWLLNPNGVLFGRDARVDVAGLVASSLGMADADWLSGRYRFSAVPSAAGNGDVVNQGQVRTPLGGRVMLLASNEVRNEGLVEAPGGQVLLAAGRSIDVVDSGAPNVALQVTAPQGQALNLGTLSAAGGRIDMQAGVVNQQGVVRADGLAAGPGGTIVLRGGSVNLAQGSVTSAAGEAGGAVTVQATSGQALVDGQVDAGGRSGRGGDVRLLGRQVGLLDHAEVLADGGSGGGTVLVGGGAEGKDASVPNAQATYMAPTASISADARGRGDGGHIVLWGDDATRAYGRLSARGGAQGGDGGLIETSGGWLDAQPAYVSAAASAGKAGTWLLDPNDILISDSFSVNTNVTSGPNFTTTGDSAQLRADDIRTALNNGANVVISTSTGAPNTQQGDITLSLAGIDVTPGTATTLTLNAHHDIILNSSSITSDGAPLSVTLNAGKGGSGGVLMSGGTIDTGGGNLTIKGHGVDMTGSLFTGAGIMQIYGDTVFIGSDSSLSSIASGTAIQFRGYSGNFVQSFNNDAGSSAVSSSPGRWLLYVDSPSAIVNDGGLPYTFVMYGTGALPDATNNGVVYNQSPVATLATSITPSKAYDKLTSITLVGTGLAVTGGQINGDTVSVTAKSSELYGNFADANAGTGKAIAVNPLAVSAVDPAGHVVYGYQVGTVSGAIIPLTVTASAAADNKVYDGTTAATVRPWTLSGVLYGDTVSAVTTSAQFLDRNVGTGKTVTATATLSGTDAGNYSLAPTSVGTADITPRSLTAAPNVSDKVYDGTVAATIGSWSLSGAVAGDAVSVAVASAQFSDRNVGTNKAVNVSGAVLSGADAGNYTLGSTSGGSASITPRPLTASGTVQDKVYDGSTFATVTNLSLSGVLSGDTVSLVGGPAQFADRNVGTAKPVTASLSLSGADAGNYSVAGPVGSASITPATLTYVAQPATMVSGGALPSLTGNVTGFVGGDTEVSATTGALAFTTTASSATPPGQYAIDGGGLSATNYVFTQSAGNATALTISSSPVVTPVTPTTPSSIVTTDSETPVLLAKGTDTVIPAGSSTGPSGGSVVDAFSVLKPDPQGGAMTFTPLPVDAMSQGGLARLLRARDDYKDSVFAASVAQLARNPSLADLPGCQTAEQLNTGSCLLTDELKRKLDGRRPAAAGVVAAAPNVAPPATPATPAAAPAPVPAPAAAAAAPAVPVAAPLPALPQARAVRSAALPAIQRKVAVVVGINRYDDKRIPQLDNAVNDAQAIATTFESTLGYETIVLPNATRSTLVATLNRLALALEPRDSLVVYYAGHGELVQTTGQGYWIPANGESQDPRTWLSNTDIAKLLRQFDASQVALISDSCYSGSLVTSERIRPSTSTLDPQQVLARKVAVAMSSGGKEPVADAGKQGHSPFAWHLMQSLQGLQGWQPGGNVFERVRFAVARELPQRPQYGAASVGEHTEGTDYLFERRQLAGQP